LSDLNSSLGAGDLGPGEPRPADESSAKPPLRPYLGRRSRQTQRVGYAVVGLGHLAERAILPAFEGSRKSRVVAVVSGNAQRAWEVAKPYGAADFSYDEYDACLAKPEVEAVYIASVNSAHADQAVRAAAARKHVLCEKPMAPTVKECRRMIEACEATRVRLMIAYRKYFEPASQALKILIGKGELGRLKIIHSTFTVNLPDTKTAAWHLDKDVAGGGSLVDVGVYCVNTARWLLGTEPLEASAYAWTVDPKRFRRSCGSTASADGLRSIPLTLTTTNGACSARSRASGSTGTSRAWRSFHWSWTPSRIACGAAAIRSQVAGRACAMSP